MFYKCAKLNATINRNLEEKFMWIIFGIISVVFCVIGWIMTVKHSSKAPWAAACSLAFVSLTLLMEYKMVFNWVNKEDWSALLDVVPSMFSVLTGYVIVMILANIVTIVSTKRQN